MSAGSVIEVFGSAVGFVTGAVMVRLLAEDATVWLPRLNYWLVSIAVRRLPDEKRERYAEEWAAHIEEMPGNVVPFFVALQLQWASFQTAFLARETDIRLRYESWQAEHTARSMLFISTWQELNEKLEEIDPRCSMKKAPRLGPIMEAAQKILTRELIAQKPRPSLSFYSIIIIRREIRAIYRRSTYYFDRWF